MFLLFLLLLSTPNQKQQQQSVLPKIMAGLSSTKLPEIIERYSPISFAHRFKVRRSLKRPVLHWIKHFFRPYTATHPLNMYVTTFLLACLVAVALYLRQLVRKNFSYWQDLGIPCDEPGLMTGNMQGVTKTKAFLQIFQEYYDKYKNSHPFVGFYWFFRPAVFVTDPVLLKLILIKDFSNFVDRGMFVNEEDDPLTGHLFNLDGARWRHMRSKLSPTFTSGKMKIMYPLVSGVGQQFIQVFNETVDSNNIVEIKDFMARFTTDVIGTCAFGLEINSLRKPDAKFRNMSRKAFVEHSGGTMGLGFRFSFPKLAKRLHMRETLPEVEKYFMGIVRDTVEYREKNNVRRNDFMDMLIDLKNNKLIKSETGDELTNLSFGEIAAQAFVFLLAGFETSSTTLGFILYELAQNVEIQQRARNEVLDVFQRHNNEFTYECMKELVYLEQIMMESLRLYSTVPFLNREALEDYVVPGYPKFVIKKGMTVLIPASAIHRDERYYPQPNVFNPDNYSPENVAQRDSVLTLSFGDGPRICIGMRFAKMQVLVGLALLLKNFKFTTCEKTQIPIKYDIKSFLTSSEGGIFLKVEKF